MTINGDTKYLATLEANGAFGGLLANNVAIRNYPNPAANVGSIYYQNKSSTNPRMRGTRSVPVPNASTRNDSSGKTWLVIFERRSKP